MLRLVFALPALVVAAAAVAAPVPAERPADTLRRLFGTPSDPDQDCQFELEGARLRVTVPAAPHRLVPNGGPSNAPRVTRPAEGDFTATVTIRAPKAGANAQGSFYAGLVIDAGADTYLYHARRLVVGGDTELTGLNGLRVGTTAVASGSIAGELYRSDAVVFRLTRAGRVVKLAASRDGADWSPTGEIAADLPARVAVGVFAAHDGSAPLTAEFRSFAVTSKK